MKEKGSTILLWEILGCTIMPGIGMLAATYIMFDNMNRIALVYNNEITEKDLPKLDESHPHLVRNVVIIYAVVLAVVIGLMNWGLQSVLFSNPADDYSDWDSGAYSENRSDYSDEDYLDDTYSSDYSDYADGSGAADTPARVPGSANPQKIVVPMRMVNNTGAELYFLYVSEANSDNWGEDILDATGAITLPAGESLSISFAFYSGHMIWDFKTIDENDNELTYYDVDFSNCSTDGIVLVFNADGTVHLE